MANLIMPDTFEPYYAGREDESERRITTRPQPKKRLERGADGEIVLPEEAPAPADITRRIRRPISH
jgi:hypothetical protein